MPWKGKRDHAPRLPSQIEDGRRAYAEGESVKEGNEPLKQRKRRRFAVLDADRGIEPGDGATFVEVEDMGIVAEDDLPDDSVLISQARSS